MVKDILDILVLILACNENYTWPYTTRKVCCTSNFTNLERSPQQDIFGMTYDLKTHRHYFGQYIFQTGHNLHHWLFFLLCMCWLHVPVQQEWEQLLQIMAVWSLGSFCLLHSFQPFGLSLLIGLFVLFMLVGIFEPNRSFVTSELLDANLHHLTPFYLFDHLCQMAPLCWLGHLFQFIF